MAQFLHCEGGRRKAFITRPRYYEEAAQVLGIIDASSMCGHVSIGGIFRPRTRVGAVERRGSSAPSGTWLKRRRSAG
jgi:hypothetical protein